jgi:Rrf2 family nitric oxide-sensitive transcriptional repressor
MKLTDYTDYSLRTLIYVAVHPDELVTIQQIADTFSVPKNHLIKVVQRLGQLGYLYTLRGRTGGIRLGRAASEINVGEVIRATEPDFGMVECFRGEENRCVITGACGLQHVLAEALRAWFAVIDGYTLEDLLGAPTLTKALGIEVSIPLTRLRLKGGPRQGSAGRGGAGPGSTGGA